MVVCIRSLNYSLHSIIHLLRYYWNKYRQLRIRLAQVIFGGGMVLFLSGAFEIAYDAWKAGVISSPVWSSLFGIGILHHYLIGFIVVIIAWIVMFVEEDK